MKASYAAAVVALAGVASCSFMVTGLAEPAPGQSEPVCSSSSAPPLIDLGLTLVYAGVFMLAPLTGSDSAQEQSPEVDRAMATSALLVATHAVSALHGTVSAERCLGQRYAAAAAPPGPPPAPIGLEMWCTRTPARAACARTEGHCHRLRGEIAPDGTAPACEPTVPACFRVDGALRVCAPDFGSCARERAIYDARSPGTHSLSACSR